MGTGSVLPPDARSLPSQLTDTNPIETNPMIPANAILLISSMSVTPWANNDRVGDLEESKRRTVGTLPIFGRVTNVSAGPSLSARHS